MDRKPVRSSNLKSIGYDPDRRILEVEFDTRSVYQYYAVPLYEYEGLMQARSHGSYFSRHIKTGPYSHHKVR